jgi:hypothetical protein
MKILLVGYVSHLGESDYCVLEPAARVEFLEDVGADFVFNKTAEVDQKAHALDWDYA